MNLLVRQIVESETNRENFNSAQLSVIIVWGSINRVVSTHDRVLFRPMINQFLEEVICYFDQKMRSARKQAFASHVFGTESRVVRERDN